MEYTRINALTPEGEFFQSEALNEGIWLSVGHLNALESQLETDMVTTEQLRKQNSNLDAQLAAMTDMMQRENEAAATLRTENQKYAQRIVELEAQVTILGQQPSGPGTTVEVKEDPISNAEGVPSYLRDDNPINVWIDSKLKKRSA